MLHAACVICGTVKIYLVNDPEFWVVYNTSDISSFITGGHVLSKYPRPCKTTDIIIFRYAIYHDLCISNITLIVICYLLGGKPGGGCWVLAMGETVIQITSGQYHPNQEGADDTDF
jgi:hypothetical protein